MQYTIEITRESGWCDSIRMGATTRKAAIRELRRWMQDNPEIVNSALIFLGFVRDSDGVHGHVNEDGLAPIGKPWNREGEPAPYDWEGQPEL